MEARRASREALAPTGGRSGARRAVRMVRTEADGCATVYRMTNVTVHGKVAAALARYRGARGFRTVEEAVASLLDAAGEPYEAEHAFDVGPALDALERALAGRREALARDLDGPELRAALVAAGRPEGETVAYGLRSLRGLRDARGRVLERRLSHGGLGMWRIVGGP